MMKKKLITALVVAFFAIVITLSKIKDYSAFFDDIPSLLMVTYGGAIYYQGISFFRMLTAIIPFIAQVILMIDFIAQDIDTVSVYVFTRTKRRHGWLLGRLARLGLVSMLYYTAYYLITIIIGFSTGLTVADAGVLLKTLGLLYLTGVAWSTLFMLAITVFTIKVKPSLVLSVSVSSFIVWIFVLPLLPRAVASWLVPLMPFSHALLAAHDLSGVFDLSGFIGERAFSMPLGMSALYLAFCAAIFYAVSCVWINRTDFLPK